MTNIEFLNGLNNMEQNILMLLAHPNLAHSIGNKLISKTIGNLNNSSIRNLAQLYPNFNIDVKAEQQALLNADVIIFQYPLFWYNVPAILKEWIDQVFTYGFAFGSDGFKLKDKKVIVSFTMGSSKKDYPPDVIEKIVFPLKGLSSYCKMKYLGEIFSTDINNYTDGAEEKAKVFATNHANELIKLINLA